MADPHHPSIVPRVLLVDDRADKLMAMEAVVAPLGCEIVAVNSGAEALRFCEQQDCVVILLDVRMPGMNGFDTAAELRRRERSARTPIIFVSVAESPELLEQAYALGAVDYIQHLEPNILRAKVSVFIDLYRQRMEILEHQIAEQKLREARDDAERANAAKDRFIAALSHELRTPLTPVIALLPALLESEAFSDEVRSDLEMIYRSVQLETHLINDLLDLTSITNGRFPLNLQKTPMHALVNRVIEVVAPEVRAARIALQADLGAENLHVWADPLRIQQVLSSLLTNAVRYTPHGGKVQIRTLNGDTGNFVLEVSDTGIGFAPEEAAKLFEAFERPAATQGYRFGGLGLGLFIAKAIVHQHAGTLTASSAGRGRGSVFRLELPTTNVASATASPGSLGSTLSARALRILLVEDDRNTREVLTRLLAKRRHAVQSAETVQDALMLASRNEFDLIISDLGLPDGSGLELMPQLKSLYGMRGIAVSGYGMEEDLKRSRLAGFEAHLTKPVDFSTLEAAVREISTSIP